MEYRLPVSKTKRTSCCYTLALRNIFIDLILARASVRRSTILEEVSLESVAITSDVWLPLKGPWSRTRLLDASVFGMRLPRRCFTEDALSLLPLRRTALGSTCLGKEVARAREVTWEDVIKHVIDIYIFVCVHASQ